MRGVVGYGAIFLHFYMKLVNTNIFRKNINFFVIYLNFQGLISVFCLYRSIPLLINTVKDMGRSSLVPWYGIVGKMRCQATQHCFILEQNIFVSL